MAKKCNACNNNTMEIEILFEVLKSTIIQLEAANIAKHADKGCDTPSYVKSLCLMLSSN
jgi:hypothetical protein